eukprot:CAMPEP_0197525144 /NCGR_PEP_ID=MMETSP1318-20131121/10644_1 /TAXON_ID=552666 /ORGANISM="Partenskyella glossopodia, Strain RCC365" /LENGTH=402 /DNA_ID=CAMNT_0043078317 /DNA_START=64 /DNA_END=1272 /DNA_ORIENTATION=+
MPQNDGKLLMIPGPCEFHEDVLKVVGEASPSHVAPSFIEEFGATIGMLRDVFLTATGQPFVIAGSGSLGWDFVAANLVEPGEKVLVCNTGYFSDAWAMCIKAYKGEVVNLQMPVGAAVCPKMLEAALKKEKYKVVCLTQVDTSTGVKNDIATLSAIVKKIQPDCLVTCDGVCAFAAEELRFDDWNVDAALTGSQKALGVPPGLMVCIMSQKALRVVKNRSTPILSYFANAAHWLPIMQAYEARKPSYFATPAVTLVRGLYVACKKLLAMGMPAVFDAHLKTSLAFKEACYSMGLELVATERKHAANTLSAVKFPAGVTKAQLLPKITKRGVIVAGGLHKKIKMTYFRVGHMGLSALDPKRQHMVTVIEAIEGALIECGKNIEKGKALSVYKAYMGGYLKSSL